MPRRPLESASPFLNAPEGKIATHVNDHLRTSDDVFADLQETQTDIIAGMDEATDALSYQIAELEVDLAATVGDDDGADEFGAMIDDIFGGDETDYDDLFGESNDIELDDLFGV